MCDRGAETSGVLDYCLRHKIAFIAHGALGGLDARRGKKDVARSFPRLKKVAEEMQVSTHAAALALMRHRWPNLIHITGSSACALLSMCLCVHSCRCTAELRRLESCLQGPEEGERVSHVYVGQELDKRSTCVILQQPGASPSRQAKLRISGASSQSKAQHNPKPQHNVPLRSVLFGAGLSLFSFWLSVFARHHLLVFSFTNCSPEGRDGMMHCKRKKLARSWPEERQVSMPTSPNPCLNSTSKQPAFS